MKQLISYREGERQRKKEKGESKAESVRVKVGEVLTISCGINVIFQDKKLKTIKMIKN